MRTHNTGVVSFIIGEEGNGKPPHKIHFPRKNSKLCLWFLLRSKSSLQSSERIYKFHSASKNSPSKDTNLRIVTSRINVVSQWQIDIVEDQCSSSLVGTRYF